MKIGVVSDSHDRAEMVVEAIRLMRERGAELILHCGDIQEPAIVQHFAGVPTRFVLGNWDTDVDGLRRAIDAIGGTLHDELGELEIDGRNIAWTHGHHVRLLQDLERYELYDFIFHGHTHRIRKEQMGRTTVVNPGALFRCPRKTCVVLDLATGEVEFVTVELPRSRPRA
jgi:hypothetical protein